MPGFINKRHKRSTIGSLRSAVSAVALASVAAITPVLAQDFDRQVVFGDSLSDPGNILPGLRFTNGALYSEIIQDTFAIDDENVVNLAVGGAKTSQLLNADGNVSGNISDALPFLATTDLTNQASSFLDSQGSRVSSDTLFIVNGGGNNGFTSNAISFLPGTTDPASVLQAGAAQAASDIQAITSDLISAGAQTIVVPNSADLGAIPEPAGVGTFLEAESRSRLTSFTDAFNTALAENLGELASTTDADIILVDINSLFKQAQANPELFGFSNVTDACSSTPSCATASFDEQNEFLFFDGVHPNFGGHAAKAQFYTDTILAPFVLAAPAETLRDSAEARRQRLATTRLADVADERGIILFVDSGYVDLERNTGAGILGYNADGFDTGGGIGKVFDENWAAAVYGGISRYDGSFQTIGAAYDIDGFYLGGMAQGNLPYDLLLTVDASAQFSEVSTERNTGVVNQIAVGEQDATTFSISGRVLKDFEFSAFTFTPEAALGYFRADLEAFDQTGAVGLNLAVAENDSDAAYVELGGRFGRTFSIAPDTSLRPSARIVYRADFNEFDQTIVSELVSAPGVPRTTRVNGYTENSLRLEGSILIDTVDGFNVELGGGGLIARENTSTGYFLTARISKGF